VSVPKQAIEEAHLETLRARQVVAVADDPDKPPNGGGTTPHEKLQRSVSLYYESLRSYLISSPEGKRFFHGEAPDTPDEQGYGVLRRRGRDETVPLDDLGDPPEDIPDIALPEFYEGEIADLLRDGEVLDRPVSFDTADGQRVAEIRVFTYKTGLRHLDTMFQRREVVEKPQPTGFVVGIEGDFFGGRGDEDDDELRVVLQPLELLMNAARELDRAASDLDLLAETGGSDPKPFMSGFDASSNGHAESDLTQTDVGGSPDI